MSTTHSHLQRKSLSKISELIWTKYQCNSNGPGPQQTLRQPANHISTPTKHLQREREWWEDTFLLTRMFGVLDTAQSEPATATDSPNTKTLSNGRRPVRTQCEGRFRKMSNIACSIGFTVYMFDSFEMPNNLQRHNTERVCRSV